jgi:hypothetical protein
MSQQPSVGRIVHYQSYGTPGGEYLPEPRAAIVTETTPDHTCPSECAEQDPGEEHPAVASLAVLNPTGMFFKEDVPYAETPTPGHWNWPPRN